MRHIKATNQETGEIRKYSIGRWKAVITDNRGGRRETAADLAYTEMAWLEWPWVKR